MNGINSVCLKQVGIDLVQMHLKRGDTVYFITGRTQTKTETVTKYVQEGLNIPADKMQPVIFAGDQPGANNKSKLDARSQTENLLR